MFLIVWIIVSWLRKYEYKNTSTPYEKFKSLPNSDQYLKPEITFEDLDHKATMMSDFDAATQMNTALKKLFQEIANDNKQRTPFSIKSLN